MSTTVKSTDEKKPTEWTLFQKRVRALTGLTPTENMKLCSYLKKSKAMLEWKDAEITECMGRWRMEDTISPVAEALPAPEEKKPKKAKEAKEVKEAKEPKEVKEEDPTVAAPPDSIENMEFYVFQAKKILKTATEDADRELHLVAPALKKAKAAADDAAELQKKVAELQKKATRALEDSVVLQKEADKLVAKQTFKALCESELAKREAELAKRTAELEVKSLDSTEAAASDEPLHLRRKKAPKHIKTLVWNKYIGSDVAEAPCMSCRTAKISNRSFHCGHVIAESKGGDMNINNLRPVCADCNGSMGTRSMNEFTKEFFGWTV